MEIMKIYIRLAAITLNIFPSHPGPDSGFCLLSGTRKAPEDALYLIGHFRSYATLEPTLHQARIKTPVSRVPALLYFLVSSDPGVKEKSSYIHVYQKCRK